MKWSKTWKASKDRTKQRKYRRNAPLHIKRKFLSAHLSKELRERYNFKSFPIRKGDVVEIMRGEHKGKKGKVDHIDLKKTKIYIENVKRKNVKGDEIFIPFEPSNLRITELNLDDVKRLKSIKKKISKMK